MSGVSFWSLDERLCFRAMILGMVSQQTHTQASEPGLPAKPILFEPDLGSDWPVYRRLVRSLARGGRAFEIALESELAGGLGPKAYFALSVLRDISAVGGRIAVRDSRIYVSWPIWTGPDGRSNARRALEVARDDEVGDAVDTQRLGALFLSETRPDDLIRLGHEGEFVLRSAKDMHPSGLSYSDGFAAAMRYWSMPYRGRTGRTRRFVLTVEHGEFAPQPAIVGILELGDEAPFCSWRDNLIGLSLPAAEKWLFGAPEFRGALAKQRLRRIRRALRPVDVGLDLAGLSASDVLAMAPKVSELAAGRSSVEDHQEEVLDSRRRAIYGLRLATGEAAFEIAERGGEWTSEARSMFAQGVRALHDTLVPRFHMEVTVCGAVPPFSYALGGKLLVAMFAHPEVNASVKTPLGHLLARTFYVEQIEDELSSPGMTAVTTKGLYSEHSPLYTRSSMPGLDSPVQLRKIAETQGNTSTLLSRGTADAARKLIAYGAKNGERVVSRLYGSGGAKRHRALEVAAQQAGVDSRLINAGIKRPVYGASLVENAGEVAWAAAEPIWRIRSGETAGSYVDRAVSAWRERWLPKAASRLQSEELLPGLFASMLGCPLKET